MKKELIANPDNCTGCNRCTYVCSAVKEGAFVPSMARLKVSNNPFRGYSVPHICFQCPKADCMEACSTGAFSRNDAGVVVINGEKCAACGACVQACTYGMVEQDTAGIAYKCDLCGGDPACARECHADALIHVTPNPDVLRLKAAQMKARTRNGTPREKRQQMADRLLKSAR